LKAAKAPVAISIHLRRRMIFSLAQLAEELRGLQVLMRFAPLLPFGRAEQLRHLCPTHEEFLEWVAELKEYIPGSLSLIGSDFCQAAETTIAVQSSGSLTPCCFQHGITIAPANIQDISDHWRESEVLKSIRSNPPKGCTQCEVAKRFSQLEKVKV
jgi:hypothetical protein